MVIFILQNQKYEVHMKLPQWSYQNCGNFHTFDCVVL